MLASPANTCHSPRASSSCSCPGDQPAYPAYTRKVLDGDPASTILASNVLVETMEMSAKIDVDPAGVVRDRYSARIPTVTGPPAYSFIWPPPFKSG